MKEISNTNSTIKHFTSMRYVLVFEGIIVGILAGFVSVFYRYVLSLAEEMTDKSVSFASSTIVTMILWIVVLAVIAIVVARILNWQPMISGSGIPQVEAEMQGSIKVNWIKVIIAKMIAGFLCIFAGLSLGREGPSIQIGGMTGKGFSKMLGRRKIEERVLITCGASAGLSAAFNAPLAGAMFALEEVHKSFSPVVMMSAMIASVIADFISAAVFGMKPIFDFTLASPIGLKYYPLIVVLGVITGVLGVVYNKTLLFTQDLYKKIPFIKNEYKVIIPFMIAGLLGFLMPEVLGSGHHMISMLSSGNLAIKAVLILLTVKFLFSMVSFASGAPGGIFFPLLVLGAYIGGAFGMIACKSFGFDTGLVINFIVLAMSAYFTAIVRAPITGIILICEMTGSLKHILSLSLVSVIAYVTADLLKSTPIYESLLERLIQKAGKSTKVGSGEKIIIETPVEQGSEVEGKKVCDIDLPKNCLIVAVKRGEEEIIPNGNTQIVPRDILVVMYDEVSDKTSYDKIINITSIDA